MGVNRILVYDDMDGYFDAYFFNGVVNPEEIENEIKRIKTEMVGEWTLDNIRVAITEKFDVKDVVLFDNTGFGNCCTIEVNKLK